MNAAIAVAAAFGLGAIIIFAASLLPFGKKMAAELWFFYRSEFVIVGCLLLPAAGGRWTFLLLLLAMTWRGLMEWFDLFGERGLTATRLTATFAGFALVAVGIGAPGRLLPALAIAALLILLYSPIRERHAFALRVRLAICGLVYPVLPLALAGSLLAMPGGFGWILLVYATVEMNDAIALVTGKLIGRRPVLPRLSPRKTLAGLVGGAVAGGATGLLIANYVLGIGFARAALPVAVILAAGLAGDLASSALKRWRGTKDFKPVAALHGGILDIYDSFLFAAPAALLLRWAGGL